MKSTGIIRRMDELGRVVVPIEIYVEGEKIVLKKFQPNCIFCGNTKHLVAYHDKLICEECSKKIGKLKVEE